jgi:chromosome segregation ATPase
VRFRDLEVSINKIQPKFQEALNDRARFEKEIAASLQIQTKLQKKSDAKDELELELKAARLALSTSAIPEIAEFNTLKDENQSLKVEVDRLEKRRLAAVNEQSYFVNQYQTASLAATEAMQQIKELEEELKELRPKAASNAVEIHQLHNESEISQHIERIRELTTLNEALDSELERKTEELKALMNGRRGATRGTSVPRSPRLGSGTMSPGQVGVRRVFAPNGSRGTSPAAGEFSRGPAQFGEALFQDGVRGGGRWGTHLQ